MNLLRNNNFLKYDQKMVELTQTELLNGFFIVIVVIIYFYVGFKLYAKYIAYKDTKLIYLGTNVIFQSIGWFSIAITYLMIIAFGFPLPDSLYNMI